ncbi:S-adenosyl-L-methionine-dependent methyltransferase [Apiospora saccharicola]
MSAPYQAQGGVRDNRRQEEAEQDFVWLGPDTMRPLPVTESLNTMDPSYQPFHGFGINSGTNAEPLLPMEFPLGGQEGFQAQAPIFQSPGYEPMQGFGGAMSGFPIPETHFMGNDSGGNDGYVLNSTVPPAPAPAAPRDPALVMATAPRHMQLPSQVLQTRQAKAEAEVRHAPYDTSLISGWHPHEFLPEDYPDLDPAYSVDDPANPPRMNTQVPLEAWLPGEVYRVSSGSSIVEPQSVQGENGRLYNGYREGKYFLPNDAVSETKQIHHVDSLVGRTRSVGPSAPRAEDITGGKLFLAPIKNPKHVLDLATGTGIWPNEFGDRDGPQPDPARGQAAQRDVRAGGLEEAWCHHHKFDYIHARLVCTCFDNPRGVMERAFANLHPDGWAEYFDSMGHSGCLDGTLKGTALEQVTEYCQQGAAASGRDLFVAKNYRQWMEEIGFVDVVERKFAWPLGGWAKNPRLKLAGKFCQRDIYDGVAGITHVMLQRAGCTSEFIDQFTAEVRSNLVDPSIHAYIPMYAIYGRKPDKPEAPPASHPATSSEVPAPPKQTGFLPHEFLPEDFPEIDPLYLRSDVVSPAAIPSTQSGIPSEAWVPAEIYRETSGSSVVEPNSVVDRNERLDLQNLSTFLLLRHRLYLAPIQSPRYALDIATGTGLWAIEFAQAHPECHVIGTDLSKIQPENAPGNIEFIRDDSEEPWEFGPTKFDFVHARAVFTCFDDSKFVMRQAFESMNPGGWTEWVDGSTDVASLDGTHKGTALERWGQLTKAGFALKGRDIDVARHYKEWMQEVGFVDVVERKYAAPMGPWCQDERLKHIGRLFVRNLYDGIGGIMFRVMDALGYTGEQRDEFATSFRADLVDPTIHAYLPAWVVYGRKPHAWETKRQPETSQSGTKHDIQ